MVEKKCLIMLPQAHGSAVVNIIDKLKAGSRPLLLRLHMGSSGKCSTVPPQRAAYDLHAITGPIIERLSSNIPGCHSLAEDLTLLSIQHEMGWLPWILF